MGRFANSLLAATAALLSSSLSVAQTIDWTRAFNGPGGAAAYVGDGQFAGRSIAADASGNVVIAGSTGGTGQRDMLTTKLAAADGAVVWQKIFAGAAGGDDYAMSVATDASGNAIAAGTAANASNSDIEVLKYAAADGTVMWNRTIDSGNNDVGYVAATDGAGNVFVAAETYNASGNWDIRVLKLSGTNGATLWDESFDGGSDDHVSDLVVDGSGNAIVLGVTQNASGNGDILVIKYSGSTGATAWQRVIDSGGDDKGYGLALDAGGDVYVAGFEIPSTGADYVTLKLAAATGASIWTKAYDGGSDDYGQAVAIDSAGNAIVTGQSKNSAGRFVYETLKYAAADGALLWQQTFDGGVNDYAYLVSVDAADNAVVVGSTTVGSQTDWKVIAYAAVDGTQLYQYGYTGSANVNDQAYATVATPDGIVVAGTATESGSQTGARAAKLAVSTTPTVTSLVPHFYESILGRAPDPTGEAYWDGEVTRMKSLGAGVNEVWYAMASSFFSSAEYASFNRDDTGFVTDLYNAFFNRPPDASGLAYWTDQLASGMPREVALVSFMFSPEFTSYTQSLFGNTAARAEVNLVMDFYRGLLARLPDTSGFDYWVQQFRTAQCQGSSAVYAQAQAISSAFAHSAEYAARGRTNSQYVGDLYNAFLRRGGDLTGVQYWIGQVSTAQSRDTVLQSFLSSPEFAARVNAVVSQGCMP